MSDEYGIDEQSIKELLEITEVGTAPSLSLPVLDDLNFDPIFVDSQDLDINNAPVAEVGNTKPTATLPSKDTCASPSTQSTPVATRPTTSPSGKPQQPPLRQPQRHLPSQPQQPPSRQTQSTHITQPQSPSPQLPRPSSLSSAPTHNKTPATRQSPHQPTRAQSTPQQQRPTFAAKKQTQTISTLNPQQQQRYSAITHQQPSKQSSPTMQQPRPPTTASAAPTQTHVKQETNKGLPFKLSPVGVPVLPPGLPARQPMQAVPPKSTGKRKQPSNNLVVKVEQDSPKKAADGNFRPAFLLPPPGCPPLPPGLNMPALPPLNPADSKRAKKQRRLIRNRMSAQLHRERKKAHVGELERQVETLKSENKTLNDKMTHLELENAQLRQDLEKAQQQLAKKDQFGGLGFDLGLLAGHDYLDSPLSMDSDDTDNVSSSSTGSPLYPQSTDDEGCSDGSLPGAQVPRLTTANRAASSGSTTKNPSKKRRKTQRPAAATAALCLAAVVFTVSMLNDPGVNLLEDKSSPANAAIRSGSLASFVDEGRMLNPPGQPQEYNQEALDAHPGTGRKLLSLFQPAIAPPVVQYDKPAPRDDQEPASSPSSSSHSSSSSSAPPNADTNARSTRTRTGKEIIERNRLLQLAFRQEQPFSKVDSDAIQDEIRTLAQYLPYRRVRESTPDSRNAVAKADHDKGLTVYASSPASPHQRPASPPRTGAASQEEIVQKKAVQAAVRAYLTHVGAALDSDSDAYIKSSDSLIMCPQAYGMMSRTIPGAQAGSPDPQESEDMHLRGGGRYANSTATPQVEHGVPKNSTSKAHDAKPRQHAIPDPYLTLFVPSSSIHVPQWGLDGRNGGFVQLGCKLDSIRPIYNKPKEDEEEGFRVL